MKKIILSLLGMVLLLVSCKPKNTTDDPSNPLPQLSVTDVVVEEGHAAIFTVSLSKPATEEITFEYTFQSGTASLSDYETSSSASIGKIAVGETFTTIGTFTYRDDVQEEDELFQVVLKNVKHALPAKATCTIKNVQDQSADYFMQAKIDGVAWDAISTGSFVPTLSIFEGTAWPTSMTGPGLASEFYFGFNSKILVGKYEIGMAIDSKVHAWYTAADYHNADRRIVYVAQSGGELVFTKVDLVNKQAEGTFEFTAKGSNGKIVQITEGKFRVRTE